MKHTMQRKISLSIPSSYLKKHVKKKHKIRAIYRIMSFILLFTIAYFIQFNGINNNNIDVKSKQLRPVQRMRRKLQRNKSFLILDENYFETISNYHDIINSTTNSPEINISAHSLNFNESFNSKIGNDDFFLNGVVFEINESNLTDELVKNTTNDKDYITEPSNNEPNENGTSNTTICSKNIANPKSMLVVYIFGVLYMFIGIAIICDELFVPALEVMASESYLNLSMDVTGATLMAAGGSAPELFTSIIGAFSESEVGFGTIVGSAVFNVLFVIAMCSFCVKDVLVLSWWPLARDCTWYAVALSTLAIFCGYSSPGKIELWEALVQFFIYILYVTFMKFNQNIFNWIESKIQKKKVGLEEDNLTKVRRRSTRRQSISFQAGICKLIIGKETLMDRIRSCLVIQMYGDVETVFKKTDENGDGLIDKSELKKILMSLGCEVTDEELENVRKAMCNSKDKIDLAAFKKWYINSEYGIKEDLKKVFTEYDKNGSGKIEASELKRLLLKLGSINASETQIRESFKKICPGDNLDKISYDQFQEWYFQSSYWAEREQIVDESAEDTQETISENLKPPVNGSIMDYIRWLIILPIVFLFSITVPDVRGRGKEKYCFLTFILSICWIGALTYCMVSWAEVIGNTLGIPMILMGLTFLAAGTSVPDLITSVIVARMGEGDMAVSSSIGSNIFDICFGLPVPWILYCLVGSKPNFVTIGTKGMGISIAILLAMVLSIIFLIHFNGWKLTKSLGFVMIVLYVIYLAQAVIRELPLKPCN